MRMTLMGLKWELRLFALHHHLWRGRYHLRRFNRAIEGLRLMEQELRTIVEAQKTMTILETIKAIVQKNPEGMTPAAI